jgi:hypothetical protein
MNLRSSFSRRLIPLLAALGALAALIFAVGPAGASPTTGPSIEPQRPSDGSTVQATEEGLQVAFSCPSFIFEAGEVIEEEAPEESEEEIEEREEREELEEEEGLIPPPVPIRVPPPPIVIPPTMGGPEEYAVHFSTSPTVNAAGQLGTTGFGEAGEGESEPIKPTKTSCVSELELPSTATLPATLYEGKVYWQAYRESAVAPDEVEVGPVQSFNVAPNVEEPELIFREQVFAGYLTKVGFAYESELPGATVQLQEWSGSEWATIAEAPGKKSGENAFFFKPKKAGYHLFRPLVVTSGHPALGLEPEKKTVRAATKERITSAADDGAYIAANKKEAEESPIDFTVAGNGGVLRNLTAEAETTCKGPTKAQDVHIEVAARIAGAKIAPDGTVFGVTKTSGPEAWTVTLTGSIFHGRFQGELSTSYNNCTGYRVIDAVLKKGGKS